MSSRTIMITAGVIPSITDSARRSGPERVLRDPAATDDSARVVERGAHPRSHPPTGGRYETKYGTNGAHPDPDALRRQRRWTLMQSDPSTTSLYIVPVPSFETERDGVVAWLAKRGAKGRRLRRERRGVSKPVADARAVRPSGPGSHNTLAAASGSPVYGPRRLLRGVHAP